MGTIPLMRSQETPSAFYRVGENSLMDQKWPVSSGGGKIIRVGVTEAHGMAKEASKFPPPGVRYTFPTSRPASFRLIRSPIKGFLRHYDQGDFDILEAVLSPIYTECRWVYSLDCFQAALAFDLLGAPLPRSLRLAYIKRLLMRDNCKQLIFWSEAAKETLRTYGGAKDEQLLRKATVVYPAVRNVADDLIRFSDKDILILFSGDFFRKGGVNVVDAFERAQKLYPSIKLRVCSDEKIDFNTQNTALRSEYLEKLHKNPGIEFGRVPRDELVNTILPNVDIFLLPTYAEAFGFALLEAMAFGIPVISTNHFAIPEIVEDKVSGFLIDTKRFDCDSMFRGYVINDIPSDFREHVTEKLFEYLCRLIESLQLRKSLGMAGVNIVRNRFSFETRNARMLEIYRSAMQ